MKHETLMMRGTGLEDCIRFFRRFDSVPRVIYYLRGFYISGSIIEQLLRTGDGNLAKSRENSRIKHLNVLALSGYTKSRVNDATSPERFKFLVLCHFPFVPVDNETHNFTESWIA